MVYQVYRVFAQAYYTFLPLKTFRISEHHSKNPGKPHKHVPSISLKISQQYLRTSQHIPDKSKFRFFKGSCIKPCKELDKAIQALLKGYIRPFKGLYEATRGPLKRYIMLYRALYRAIPGCIGPFEGLIGSFHALWNKKHCSRRFRFQKQGFYN